MVVGASASLATFSVPDRVDDTTGFNTGDRACDVADGKERKDFCRKTPDEHGGNTSGEIFLYNKNI